jgi:hypothetical protein
MKIRKVDVLMTTGGTLVLALKSGNVTPFNDKDVRAMRLTTLHDDGSNIGDFCSVDFWNQCTVIDNVGGDW